MQSTYTIFYGFCLQNYIFRNNQIISIYYCYINESTVLLINENSRFYKNGEPKLIYREQIYQNVYLSLLALTYIRAMVYFQLSANFLDFDMLIYRKKSFV